MAKVFVLHFTDIFWDYSPLHIVGAFSNREAAEQVRDYLKANTKSHPLTAEAHSPDWWEIVELRVYDGSARFRIKECQENA